MAVDPNSIDVAQLISEHLEQAEPGSVAGDATDVRAGADVRGGRRGVWRRVRQPSAERTNSRNGYRAREWDTRAGTIELAIPKLRTGSYFPEWLLERRKRAEQAMISVVATSYLLGVSTRRVEKLVEQLGITRLSKSQVSRDGQGPRRAGRGVPQPAAGCRPVHVRGRRRADHEGPRGRPGGEQPRPGRDRGERRRAPGDPRCGHRLRGVRGRLAERSAAWSPAACPGSRWSPRTPTPGWSLRCGHPGRRGLAAVPHPLRRAT